MEKLTTFSASLQLPSGKTCTVEYAVIASRGPGGIASYGLYVAIADTGERCRIEDLSVSRQAVTDFARRLRDGAVTPAAVMDVVQESLGITL